MATSIFSIIEGLTVEKEDIIEAEVFSEQLMSSLFPTYDFRQGTALRDMVIRPNATLLALINKAVKHQFDNTDIASITNETDPDVVDSRLSNFFISRKSGNNAVVKARLYFSFPTTNTIPTIIPSGSYFSVDNETQFFPQGSISVNPDPGPELRDPLKYYFLYDSGEGLHYVDIDLESQKPTEDANINEGDLLYFTLFSPYFVSGEILYLVDTAVNTETNEDMVDRAYSSISTRNLINTPSIISGITDQFNYIKKVYPVGLGNDDLYRDLITINRIDENAETQTSVYHRGGHVDVYVDSPIVKQNLQFTLDEESSFEIKGPVIDVVRAGETQPGKISDTTPITEPYTFTPVNVSTYSENGIPDVPEDDLGLSTEQVLKVTFPLAAPGNTVTMSMETYTGLNAVSNAINSEDQRVVCADYLVRAFSPVYLDITIKFRNSHDEVLLNAKVEEYLNSIPNGGTLYIANLIEVLQDNGLSNFATPIGVKAIELNRYRERDSLNPNDTNDVVTDVFDSHQLRTTQLFKLGNMEFREIS